MLADADIKIDSVASQPLGKSGRAMIEALIAGERDPGVPRIGPRSTTSAGYAA